MKKFKKTEDERKEDMNEAFQKIRSTLSIFENSEQYESFLSFCINFRQYSAVNRILVYSQNAAASDVRSFLKWKEAGRKVKKGERSIHVLVPISHLYLKKESGEKRPEELEDDDYIRYMSFRLSPVFDISQTEPVEPAEPEVCQECSEQGRNKSFPQIVEKLRKTTSAEIAFDETGEMDGNQNCKGYYDRLKNKIVISMRNHSCDDDVLWTAVHEIAHSLMHFTVEGMFLPDAVKECEAESVAYMVTGYLGLDNAGHRVAYASECMRGTAGMDSMSVQRILDTAEQIISAVI